MTDPTQRSAEPGSDTGSHSGSGRDAAFDLALGAALRAGQEGTADLSAAVLTRLAHDTAARETPSWIAPAPLAAGFGGLMAASAALGYAGLPLIGMAAGDTVIAAALGGLLGGGF